MTLLLLDSAWGRRRTPSAALRQPEVEQLVDGGLFDDRTVELTVDRSGEWEAVVAEGDPRTVLVRPLSLEAPVSELPELTDPEREELHRTWATGGGDYDTTDPVTEQQLTEIAAALERPVPPQLAALLRLSDGAAVSRAVDDHRQTMTSGWELSSAAEIAAAHASWSALAADGPYDGPAFDLGTPSVTLPRLVHPGWIPFAQDGGGNHLAVDTVPGPAGRAGQVLEFGPDLYEGPVVRADSIVDFLAGRRHTPPRIPDLDTMVRPATPRPLLPEDVPPTCQSLRLFALSSVTGTTIARAAGVKRVILRDITSVDLEGLSEVPLQELRLLDLDEIDLAPLAHHPSLRGLHLEDVRTVRGAAALRDLPALESVELAAPVDRELVDALAGNLRLHRVTFDLDVPLSDVVGFVELLRPGVTTQVALLSRRGTS